MFFETLFWKNTYFIFFSDFYYFYHHACVHPLTNLTKPLNFFKGNKAVKKKCFLQNVFFLLYHLSSVPSLITLLLEKVFHEKTSHKKLLFLKLEFKILLSFLCTLLIIYTKASKNLINLKVILYQKVKQALNMFFFLSSLLCTRTDTSLIQKNISWKWFFWITFFLKNFLKLSWATPLIIFTKPIKKRFSWK